jgi:hypothetical protein
VALAVAEAFSRVMEVSLERGTPTEGESRQARARGPMLDAGRKPKRVSPTGAAQERISPADRE